MYSEPAVAVAPEPCRLCVLHVAPVLPAQGIGVLETCVAGGVVASFISPAIRMRASCPLSILKAWPRSTKNSENNSAAPIESRAEFLFIMHLPMFGTLTLVLAMRISNQRASRSCSRLLHVYPLICWIYLARCRDGERSECLGNQPGIESDLIMMESEWMQQGGGIRSSGF